MTAILIPALLVLSSSALAGATPPTAVDGLCQQAHGDVVSVREFVVGEDETRILDGDTIIVADQVVVYGVLLGAPATSPDAAGSSLCIQADSLQVSGLICAGSGFDQEARIGAADSGAYEGSAGGRGGSLVLDVPAVGVAVDSGAVLCSGDGGDGESILAYHESFDQPGVCTSTPGAGLIVTGGDGGDSGDLVAAEATLAVLAGMGARLRLGDGGAGGSVHLLYGNHAGGNATGGDGGASGGPTYPGAEYFAGGTGGEGGDAVSVPCPEASLVHIDAGMQEACVEGACVEAPNVEGSMLARPQLIPERPEGPYSKELPSCDGGGIFLDFNKFVNPYEFINDPCSFDEQGIEFQGELPRGPGNPCKQDCGLPIPGPCDTGLCDEIPGNPCDEVDCTPSLPCEPNCIPGNPCNQMDCTPGNPCDDIDCTPDNPCDNGGCDPDIPCVSGCGGEDPPGGGEDPPGGGGGCIGEDEDGDPTACGNEVPISEALDCAYALTYPISIFPSDEDELGCREKKNEAEAFIMDCSADTLAFLAPGVLLVDADCGEFLNETAEFLDSLGLLDTLCSQIPGSNQMSVQPCGELEVRLCDHIGSTPGIDVCQNDPQDCTKDGVDPVSCLVDFALFVCYYTIFNDGHGQLISACGVIDGAIGGRVQGEKGRDYSAIGITGGEGSSGEPGEDGGYSEVESGGASGSVGTNGANAGVNFAFCTETPAEAGTSPPAEAPPVAGGDAKAQGGRGGPALVHGGPGGSAYAVGGTGGRGGNGGNGGDGLLYYCGLFGHSIDGADGALGVQGANGGKGTAIGGEGGYALMGGDGGNAKADSSKGGDGGNGGGGGEWKVHESSCRLHWPSCIFHEKPMNGQAQCGARGGNGQTGDATGGLGGEGGLKPGRRGTAGPEGIEKPKPGATGAPGPTGEPATGCGEAILGDLLGLS